MLSLMTTPALLLSLVVGGRLAIVASSSTADGQMPLRYADRDAERVAEVLRELGGFDQIWSLREPEPGALRAAFARAEQLASSDAKLELVIYYSGHADSQGLLLGKERFPYQELRQSLARSRAAVRVAVLDACRAGGAVLPKGGRPTGGFPIADMPATRVQGAAILAASTATESAQESGEIEGSYFTHHLLSAMRGAGDRNDNGLVTLGEAYEYAYGRTVAATLPSLWGPQHPSFDYRLTGTGELVLTNLRRAGHALWLPTGKAATYYVATLGNEMVGEVMAEPDRRARLVLPPGRYRVIRRQEGRAYAAEVDLRGRDVDVSGARFAELDAELALSKGRDPGRRNEFLVELALAGLGLGSINSNGELGVGYLRRWQRWAFGPHLGYGRTEGSAYGAEYRISRFSVTAYGLRRVRLRFTELQIGAVAGVAVLHQSLVDGDHSGMGPVAMAAAALEVPLGERLAVRFLWGAGGELLKLSGQLRFIPELRAALSLSWLH